MGVEDTIVEPIVEPINTVVCESESENESVVLDEEKAISLDEFATPPKPFIKRIISFIGVGIGREDELIEALGSSEDDVTQIRRLLDDMIDNKDIIEARGISGRFLCLKKQEEEFKLAFEAIEFTNEDSGFFDNWSFL
jgi:hypothetical protein